MIPEEQAISDQTTNKCANTQSDQGQNSYANSNNDQDKQSCFVFLDNSHQLDTTKHKINWQKANDQQWRYTGLSFFLIKVIFLNCQIGH